MSHFERRKISLHCKGTYRNKLFAKTIIIIKSALEMPDDCDGE